MKYTAKAISKLQNLLERTYEAEKGFKSASENTANVFLAKYFERKSIERCNFGEELNREMKLFDIELGKVLELEVAIHRAWLDMKELFELEDGAEMLEKVLQAEKTAIEEYKEILHEASLPFVTHTILVKQKEAIESDLRTIKSLDDLN